MTTRLATAEDSPARDTPIALDASSRWWSLLAAGACLLPLLLQLPANIGAVVAAAALLVTAMSWRQPLPALLRALLALGVIGVVLVNTGFVFGRDTGCALLAAMLAIKPSETFTLRDGRSLLGFALFAPFATFLLDQGPLSLLFGLVGATLVLAALLRLAELESFGADARRHALPPGRRLLMVWRLVGIGLPLALAVFWLFPRFGTPLWGVPERALARPGLSDSMSPGEWIDLMTDDTPALRVQFIGPAPATSQMYWRGPVLSNFDGRSWTRAQWMRGLPPAVVRSGPQRWVYQLELEPTDRRELVALDLPTAAPEGATLSHDYGLRTARSLDTLTRWQLTSASPVAYEPQLPLTLRRVALDLPEGYNPRTSALARQWRRDAGSDDAAILRRALQWIQADFAYTLDTPLPGRHAVDEFLFEQQAGFCEHFSSAFVVLMRSAGIPARVVTGYVGGYRNPVGGYWLVRRSDAHAWAEVWLAGRGWVRVDPTAAVAPERIYDTLADRMPGAFGDFAGLAPMFNVGDWIRRGWNDFVLGFDAARQQHLLQPLGMDRIDTRALLMLFGTAMGLALCWMLWLTARTEREHDPVLRAWHRMGARYARHGLAREPHEPAAAWARRVRRARPHAHNLAALSARFSDWRYACVQGDPHTLRELLRDLRAHRP